MAKKKFTDDIIDIIKQDYLKGKTIKCIAKEYSACYKTISDILKKLGIFQYTNNLWTDNEVAFLKENYYAGEWDYLIANLNNKNKENIISKASSLGLKRYKNIWDAYDIKILKYGYEHNISSTDIKKMLNNKFSEESIISKAHKIGLIKKQTWTKEEDIVLLNNYSSLDMNIICDKLKTRSRDAIIQRAMKLGLTHKTFWSPDEIKFLYAHYSTMSDENIAAHLGRTKDAVRGKRFLEKLYHPVSPGVYNYISEYLRKKNNVWKTNSAKQCNFKCVITGERFDAVHHLYGMNLILLETLEELNYPTNIKIENLTQNDLDAITNHFFIVQDRYPLGVCLSSFIHKQFHNEYGYGNNTPEQFTEFLHNHNYIKQRHTIKSLETIHRCSDASVYVTHGKIH